MFEKIKISSAGRRLYEEKLYEQVVSELINGEKRSGLWAKALANSNGIEEKAKALYIQYRVQSIKDEIEISTIVKHQAENEAEINTQFNQEHDQPIRKSRKLFILLWIIIGLFALLLVR